METALSLSGYDISGRAALLSIGAYIVAGVFLIWCWPKISVPWPKTNGTYVALEDDTVCWPSFWRRAARYAARSSR